MEWTTRAVLNDSVTTDLPLPLKAYLLHLPALANAIIASIPQHLANTTNLAPSSTGVPTTRIPPARAGSVHLPSASPPRLGPFFDLEPGRQRPTPNTASGHIGRFTYLQ